MEIQILNHLKNISPNMFQELSNEIVIHCPFCDDSTRQNAHKSGHLYIAKDTPVFNCFRCNSSGTLLKLLVLTDFNDLNIIGELKSKLKHNFTKDIIIRKHIDKQIFDKIWYKNLQFRQSNNTQWNIFKHYMFNRIGIYDFYDFLIYPDIVDDSICCRFNNFDGKNVNNRMINHEKIRYYKSNGFYYFQDLYAHNYKNIVITEGPFDIINSYLYNIWDSAFFISISGRKYVSSIETIIFNNFLIGNYKLNVIFDNDINNKNFIKYKLTKLIKYLNNNIEVICWVPIKKDVSIFPKIEVY